MKYHNNTNKRHRLNLRVLERIHALFYRYGISEQADISRDEKISRQSKNIIDVYSKEDKLTFIVGNPFTLVLKNDSYIGQIPSAAVDFIL